MTYNDAIKSGFSLINKNWQLVLIQFGVMIIGCVSFFVFIGIPLAVAFVMFGIDLTEISQMKDLLATMREPSEIISRYLGLILVLLVSFFVYLLVVASIGIYAFGGSAGLISRIVREHSLRFNLNTFFSDSKRLFFPLVGFTAIIGAIFIVVAFVLGVFGGGAAAIISIAKEYGATLALFLGIFFALLLLCVGLILIVCTIALTLYGTAAIVFKDAGPLRATKETIKYLYRHLSALWLYCIVFGGYILISFLLILFGAPFNLIPIVGTIIAIPYQLFSYIVQSYLGLVILAITFSYYFSTEVKPSETPEKMETIVEGSTGIPDTSHTQASWHEPPHPEKEDRK